MNAQHLLAFLWLRWRLRVNQLKRGGIANAVILGILAVACVLISAVLLVVFFSIGFFALDDVSPSILMYVWDGLVVAFLFSWMAGLLAELQRSESLSLTKFLHMPVSLSSAFLINYVSSLASVSLLLFLPAMIGLSIGLLLSRGWSMLLLWPMLAAFLLMVTAITYQFQGWLAVLMANPRRRRTVIVMATMVFILLFQVPNIPNLMHLGNMQSQDRSDIPRLVHEETQKRQELQRDFQEKKMSVDEFAKRSDAIQREYGTRRRKIEEDGLRRMAEAYGLMNYILPPGWLPVGAAAAAEGRPWPILLAIVGPGLIGTASLYRAYRTTLRLYTGQYSSGSARTVAAQPAKNGKSSALFLEKKLPWMSEQATAIALAAFRSLLRAPEGKMLLLTPFLFLLIFGSIFLTRTGSSELPEAARPLLACGAMMMVLFTMIHILGNQFGFDRNGFRVYVLSPASRRDILLGKNLALAPIALTMALVAAVLIQAASPMGFDHFLALVPRFVAMYLLYSLLANVLSILSPVRIAPGSFQPSRMGGLAILLQLVFMLVWPIVLAPTLLPLGIDWVVREMGWLPGMPLDFLLSLLMCIVVIFLYGFLLRLQGDWLQASEQRILQIVTTREE